MRRPEPVSRRYAILPLLALSLPLLLTARVPAQTAPGALANAIEAAYLLKFPPFVSWHSALPPDVFTICVVGSTPVTGLLHKAADGQMVEQRRVVVRPLADVSAARGCQELFVAEGDAQSVAAALAVVRGAPVLTVTNGQTDAVAKGIVNFVLVGGHVRFEIDPAAAAASGITISSKLLNIATDVHGSAH